MTHLITANYSLRDKLFLAKMRPAIALAGKHPNNPYCQDVRRIFRNMIDKAINKRAGLHRPRGRKDCPEQVAAWMRQSLGIRNGRG